MWMLAQAGTAVVPVVQEAKTTFQSIMDAVALHGVDFALKLIGAILAWVIGSWIIKAIGVATSRALNRGKMDKTLIRYLTTSISVTLRIMLAILILGIFGIETTSFAAIFAAVGVAIGMAWSGLLANFAAGIFMIVLRPIRVGDFVTVGGVTGTVREIGLFVTELDTPDNVRAIIGNGKVFSENMFNFSTNPYRRVELLAQLNHGVDYRQAIEMLRERIQSIPNVLETPAPDVYILEFNAMGPVLCVRPYTHTDHYWSVYFATNAAIKDAFTQAGFPVPETHVQMVSRAA